MWLPVAVPPASTRSRTPGRHISPVGQARPTPTKQRPHQPRRTDPTINLSHPVPCIRQLVIAGAPPHRRRLRRGC